MEITKPNVTRKRIGNTVYIIENSISKTAKETAYNKVKRLILNSPDFSKNN